MTRLAGRPKTTHAAAAALIRKDLRAAFPGVTFSVKSRSFSGGNAVDVDWTDGPSDAQVEAVTGKYQEGSFDGMRDLYEYTNRRDDIPQVRWVQGSRSYSRAATEAAVAELNRRRGWDLGVEDNAHGGFRITGDVYDEQIRDRRGVYIHRMIHPASLLCPGCGAAILPGDRYCPQAGEPLTREGFPVVAETAYHRGEDRRYLRLLAETGGTFAVALYGREGDEWSARGGIEGEGNVAEVMTAYERDLFRDKFTPVLTPYAAASAS